MKCDWSVLVRINEPVNLFNSHFYLCISFNFTLFSMILLQAIISKLRIKTQRYCSVYTFKR